LEVTEGEEPVRRFGCGRKDGSLELSEGRYGEECPTSSCRDKMSGMSDEDKDGAEDRPPEKIVPEGFLQEVAQLIQGRVGPLAIVEAPDEKELGDGEHRGGVHEAGNAKEEDRER